MKFLKIILTTLTLSLFLSVLPGFAMESDIGDLISQWQRLDPEGANQNKSAIKKLKDKQEKKFKKQIDKVFKSEFEAVFGKSLKPSQVYDGMKSLEALISGDYDAAVKEGGKWTLGIVAPAVNSYITVVQKTYKLIKGVERVWVNDLYYTDAYFNAIEIIDGNIGYYRYVPSYLFKFDPADPANRRLKTLWERMKDLERQMFEQWRDGSETNKAAVDLLLYGKGWDARFRSALGKSPSDRQIFNHFLYRYTSGGNREKLVDILIYHYLEPLLKKEAALAKKRFSKAMAKAVTAASELEVKTKVEPVIYRFASSRKNLAPLYEVPIGRQIVVFVAVKGLPAKSLKSKYEYKLILGGPDDHGTAKTITRGMYVSRNPDLDAVVFLAKFSKGLSKTPGRYSARLKYSDPLGNRFDTGRFYIDLTGGQKPSITAVTMADVKKGTDVKALRQRQVETVAAGQDVIALVDYLTGGDTSGQYVLKSAVYDTWTNEFITGHTVKIKPGKKPPKRVSRLMFKKQNWAGAKKVRINIWIEDENKKKVSKGSDTLTIRHERLVIQAPGKIESGKRQKFSLQMPAGFSPPYTWLETSGSAVKVWPRKKDSKNRGVGRYGTMVGFNSHKTSERDQIRILVTDGNNRVATGRCQVIILPEYQDEYIETGYDENEYVEVDYEPDDRNDEYVTVDLEPDDEIINYADQVEDISEDPPQSGGNSEPLVIGIAGLEIDDTVSDDDPWPSVKPRQPSGTGAYASGNKKRQAPARTFYVVRKQTPHQTTNVKINQGKPWTGFSGSGERIASCGGSQTDGRAYTYFIWAFGPMTGQEARMEAQKKKRRPPVTIPAGSRWCAPKGHQRKTFIYDPQ